MSKLLQNIRQKPPEFRFAIAIVLSLLVTGGIAAAWVTGTFGKHPARAAVAKAPGPIDALKASVSGAVTTYQEQKGGTVGNSSAAQPLDSGIQIIDAGAAHDESDPYSGTQ